MKHKFEIPEESRATTALCTVVFFAFALSMCALALLDHIERHDYGTCLSENVTDGLDWLQKQAKEEYEAGEISFEEYELIMENHE